MTSFDTLADALLVHNLPPDDVIKALNKAIQEE